MKIQVNSETATVWAFGTVDNGEGFMAHHDWIEMFRAIQVLQSGSLMRLAAEQRPEIPINQLIEAARQDQIAPQTVTTDTIIMPTVESLFELYRLVMQFGGRAGQFPDTELKLKTAVERPNQSVFGREPYPTVFLKAACFAHTIAREHPFQDGNKRVSWAGAVCILRMYGIPFPDISSTESVYGKRNLIDEVHSAVYNLAAGSLSLKDFALWLEHKCGEGNKK